MKAYHGRPRSMVWPAISPGEKPLSTIVSKDSIRSTVQLKSRTQAVRVYSVLPGEV